MTLYKSERKLTAGLRQRDWQKWSQKGPKKQRKQQEMYDKKLCKQNNMRDSYLLVT